MAEPEEWLRDGPVETPDPAAAESAGHGEATRGRPVYDVMQDSRPDTVVVYCSDPRFQAAFDGFIANELHLARGAFVPIVVAGGGGVLARPHELPKEFKFIRERLELAREFFPLIRRVILINHEDCRYYESLKARVAALMGARLANLAGPREDLSAVAGIFSRLLSNLGLSVELYYAKFADERHAKVVFEKIGA